MRTKYMCNCRPSTVSRFVLLNPVDKLLPSLLIFSFLLFPGCSTVKQSLRPQLQNPLTTAQLSEGDLNLTLVNNEPFGTDHRAGYNGIAELRHRAHEESPFVPLYAGFNLEHVFGGDSLVQLFEPRDHPMSLYQPDRNEALLYQAPTPLSKVESLTSFKISAPHYIDVTFQCVLRDLTFFGHGYAGLFWASYIDAPADKKIYFWGTEGGSDVPQWIEAYSASHGEKSTHVKKDDHATLFFAKNFNATLASNYSDYQYIYPFYFGKFRNMALAFFFDSNEEIRFSQSPTGGGPENPAWDFQFIIPNPKAGKTYSFQARIVYKPFVDREDILREYRNWKADL